MKSLKCHICKKVAFSTAKAINEHIQRKHPSYRCFCLHCPKNFKQQMDATSMRLRTGPRGLFVKCAAKDSCSLKNLSYTLKSTQRRICTSVLTVQESTQATTTCLHIRPPIKIKCLYAVCRKKFNTKPNLNQHTHGHHGTGWLTPCGKSVDWPCKLSHHKHKYSTCKSIILQQKQKAKRLAKNYPSTKSFDLVKIPLCTIWHQKKGFLTFDLNSD